MKYHFISKVILKKTLFRKDEKFDDTKMVNISRTHNAMAKRTRTKGQTTIYKALQRKPMFE